ncbi:MAG TPA: glycosyltransferase family 1 protein [Ktedonobacteraceae bacterium]|jgi:glycosyltransferase involved in cell wall biosynthesis
MHVGINAQLLSFSQNYRNGGISRYIRYLLTEIARTPGDHTYTIFVNGPEVVDRLNLHHPQLTFLAASWPQTRPAARVAWEQWTLPRLLRKHRIQVFHSPANVLPELLPRTCAGVVTLHDLAFLRMPEVLTPARRLYHRIFTVRSLRQASGIITVSRSTACDVTDLLGIAHQRMTTVYPCIDERFTRPLAEDELQTFRERQGLAQGFLLYLGTLEPRKNIAVLLEAYARMRQLADTRVKLVLAGGKGWLYDTIFARVRQLNLEADVLFPGFVSDAEQPFWYRAARAFAYPSLYEGFGLPVAEALACGTPVVTSTVSSLPEAGAGLALTADPRDVEALARALLRALCDPSVRERCQAQAATVYERFSATAMVRQTLAMYEQAVASRVAQPCRSVDTHKTLFRSDKESKHSFSHQHGKE